MGEAEASIQVLMHGHAAARQAGSPAHRLDLQAEILNADGVVPIHRALELQREDQIQIAAAARHERAARLRRPHLKTAVELGHVVFPQKRIRRFQRRDPGQPQFLRQTSLPGPEVALTASPRLRRVGGVPPGSLEYTDANPAPVTTAPVQKQSRFSPEHLRRRSAEQRDRHCAYIRSACKSCRSRTSSASIIVRSTVPYRSQKDVMKALRTLLSLLPLFSGFRGSLDIQQMQYGCGGGKFHRFLVVGHCQLCGLK